MQAMRRDWLRVVVRLVLWPAVIGLGFFAIVPDGFEIVRLAIEGQLFPATPAREPSAPSPAPVAPVLASGPAAVDAPVPASPHPQAAHDGPAIPVDTPAAEPATPTRDTTAPDPAPTIDSDLAEVEADDAPGFAIEDLVDGPVDWNADDLPGPPPEDANGIRIKTTGGPESYQATGNDRPQMRAAAVRFCESLHGKFVPHDGTDTVAFFGCTTLHDAQDRLEWKRLTWRKHELRNHMREWVRPLGERKATQLLELLNKLARRHVRSELWSDGPTRLAELRALVARYESMWQKVYAALPMPAGLDRVTISFSSASAGPHFESVKRVETFLAEQEQRLGRSIARREVSWGLEGESTLCFALTEFDAAGQERFVRDALALLTTTERVALAEYNYCPRDRRAGMR